jgi:hypothetical protein
VKSFRQAVAIADGVNTPHRGGAANEKRPWALPIKSASPRHEALPVLVYIWAADWLPGGSNHGSNQAKPFRPRSAGNGNLEPRDDVWSIGHPSHCNSDRGDVMRKILTALVAAATIAAAAVATPTTADARWGGHGGWHGGGWHGGGWHGGGWRGGAFLGGLAAGALIGGAIAAQPYYYSGYGAYGAYPYYGPTCAWRSVWTAYGWRRVCY